MKPQRIQRKRTKGWRMPPNTVCVTRPGRFGNPFVPGKPQMTVPGLFVRDADHAVELYRQYMTRVIEVQSKHGCDWLAPLRGKNLACYCKPGKPCHADVLLELANKEPVQ